MNKPLKSGGSELKDSTKEVMPINCLTVQFPEQCRSRCYSSFVLMIVCNFGLVVAVKSNLFQGLNKLKNSDGIVCWFKSDRHITTDVSSQ